MKTACILEPVDSVKARACYLAKLVEAMAALLGSPRQPSLVLCLP